LSSNNISPTRINLIQTRKTLNLAESGREVLERKRDILLRELRNSIYEAERAREEMGIALLKAYQSLTEANIGRGSEIIANVAQGSNAKAFFSIDSKSIMGVSVPSVKFKAQAEVKPDYGFGSTNVELDKSFMQFANVLSLIADLARAEGASFQIANDVKRTQRRVNALNHVLIPRYRNIVKRIEQVLEEKDREEFVRTKIIKRLIREKEKNEI
jgi:V/A-type H+-transporting ATPase subunit D